MARRIRVKFYDVEYEVEVSQTLRGYSFRFDVSLEQCGLSIGATPERCLREACKEIMLGLKDF